MKIKDVLKVECCGVCGFSIWDVDWLCSLCKTPKASDKTVLKSWDEVYSISTPKEPVQ